MSTFDYDADGLEPSVGGGEPIPEGVYDLKIIKVVSKTSKAGDPMVTVDFEVIDSLRYNHRRVMFHNVVFLPKDKPGAGIALHFLKTIGQPFQGKFKVNAEKWVGSKVRATVGIREHEGKRYNTVTAVLPYEGIAGAAKEAEEEIPF